MKKRYPDGANFNNVDKLFEANADLSARLNTLKKDAPQVLGMSFGKWLKTVGLIGRGEANWEAAERFNGIFKKDVIV